MRGVGAALDRAYLCYGLCRQFRCPAVRGPAVAGLLLSGIGPLVLSRADGRRFHAEAQADYHQRMTPRVLIIEDDPSLNQMLALHLEDQGYAVHSAECREAGLALAREQPVELILLDQQLPDGEGIQTVSFAPRTARFLKIEARSEVRGRPWASLAELAVIEARNNLQNAKVDLQALLGIVPSPP